MNIQVSKSRGSGSISYPPHSSSPPFLSPLRNPSIAKSKRGRRRRRRRKANHPAKKIGGKKILSRVAGKDASKQFWKYHNESILKKYKSQLQIGSLDTKQSAEAPEKKSEPKKKKDGAVKPQAESGAVVRVPGQDVDVNAEPSEPLEPFGDLIPFADPSWYQGVGVFLLLFLCDDVAQKAVYARGSLVRWAVELQSLTTSERLLAGLELRC